MGAAMTIRCSHTGGSTLRLASATDSVRRTKGPATVGGADPRADGLRSGGIKSNVEALERIAREYERRGEHWNALDAEVAAGEVKKAPSDAKARSIYNSFARGVDPDPDPVEEAEPSPTIGPAGPDPNSADKRSTRAKPLPFEADPFGISQAPSGEPEEVDPSEPETFESIEWDERVEPNPEEDFGAAEEE